MTIQIRPIGGYQEVGRNMVAIKVDNEVVIFDMGLHMPNYITLTDDEEHERISTDILRQGNALPDDTVLEDWKDKVKAIIPSHAHLDHIGAIPWMASEYNCPIVATPFSMAVLRKILRDERFTLPNKMIEVESNETYKISEHLSVEFIHMTHSIPQTCMLALQTPYGVVLYADDFKFDNTPILESKPNYKALERIAKIGVKAAIVDCLYAPVEEKTPSEAVAKEMLKEVLLDMDTKGKAVIVTTFSSHIARLQSIVECGRKMKRKIVFCGRSLAKYVEAAEEVGLVKFSGMVEICAFPKHVAKKMKMVMHEGTEKYLFVVTGHQGESKAILSKIANRTLPLQLRKGDFVVFSCKTIPVPINLEQRQVLEEKLAEYHVRMFKNVHVSGHPAKEDLREFLNMVKPQHIIPFHGVPKMSKALQQLGLEHSYKQEEIHIVNNGQTITFK